MFSPYTLNHMLKTFGRDVLLKQTTASTYDNETGSVTNTQKNYRVRAYFYNDVPEMTEDTSRVFGSKRVVMSNTLLNGLPTPLPKVQDKIEYSTGETSAVTKVSPISTNDKVVCYILHLDE